MTKRQKFLLYLYGTPNIIGCLLGILGLALFFTGIINQFWFLIVIGLYAIGVLATPRSPSYELSMKNQLTADDIREELDDLIREIMGKVPKDGCSGDVCKAANNINFSKCCLQLWDVSGAIQHIYTIRKQPLECPPGNP